jgi:hypothetical protein
MHSFEASYQKLLVMLVEFKFETKAQVVTSISPLDAWV